MILKTEMRLIKSACLCGLATFVINALFILVGDIQLILILTNILPGFIFGLALTGHNEELPSWRRLLFIISSGGLFIFVAWLATDYHLSFHSQLTFMLASLLGAYGLLLFYYTLINRFIILWKAFLFATLTGIVSAILPAKAYHDEIISSIGTPYDMIIVMCIFFLWQTLFGLTIVLSSPAATNSGLVKAGLSNNG